MGRMLRRVQRCTGEHLLDLLDYAVPLLQLGLLAGIVRKYQSGWSAGPGLQPEEVPPQSAWAVAATVGKWVLDGAPWADVPRQLMETGADFATLRRIWEHEGNGPWQHTAERSSMLRAAAPGAAVCLRLATVAFLVAALLESGRAAVEWSLAAAAHAKVRLHHKARDAWDPQWATSDAAVSSRLASEVDAAELAHPKAMRRLWTSRLLTWLCVVLRGAWAAAWLLSIVLVIDPGAGFLLRSVVRGALAGPPWLTCSLPLLLVLCIWRSWRPTFKWYARMRLRQDKARGYCRVLLRPGHGWASRLLAASSVQRAFIGMQCMLGLHTCVGLALVAFALLGGLDRSSPLLLLMSQAPVRPSSRRTLPPRPPPVFLAATSTAPSVGDPSVILLILALASAVAGLVLILVERSVRHALRNPALPRWKGASNFVALQTASAARQSTLPAEPTSADPQKGPDPAPSTMADALPPPRRTATAATLPARAPAAAKPAPASSAATRRKGQKQQGAAAAAVAGGTAAVPSQGRSTGAGRRLTPAAAAAPRVAATNSGRARADGFLATAGTAPWRWLAWWRTSTGRSAPAATAAASSAPLNTRSQPPPRHQPAPPPPATSQLLHTQRCATHPLLPRTAPTNSAPAGPEQAVRPTAAAAAVGAAAAAAGRAPASLTPPLPSASGPSGSVYAPPDVQAARASAAALRGAVGQPDRPQPHEAPRVLPTPHSAAPLQPASSHLFESALALAGQVRAGPVPSPQATPTGPEWAMPTSDYLLALPGETDQTFAARLTRLDSLPGSMPSVPQQTQPVLPPERLPAAAAEQSGGNAARPRPPAGGSGAAMAHRSATPLSPRAQLTALVPELPTSAAAAGGTAPVSRDDDSCVICWASERTSGFLHAGRVHKCVCAACAAHFQVGAPCPMCRAPVEQIVGVFES